MAQLVPLLPSMGRSARALVRTGFVAGDGLRRLAGTPAATLPPGITPPSYFDVWYWYFTVGASELPFANPNVCV